MYTKVSVVTINTNRRHTTCRPAMARVAMVSMRIVRLAIASGAAHTSVPNLQVPATKSVAVVECSCQLQTARWPSLRRVTLCTLHLYLPSLRRAHSQRAWRPLTLPSRLAGPLPCDAQPCAFHARHPVLSPTVTGQRKVRAGRVSDPRGPRAGRPQGPGAPPPGPMRSERPSWADRRAPRRRLGPCRGVTAGSERIHSPYQGTAL